VEIRTRKAQRGQKQVKEAAQEPKEAQDKKTEATHVSE
jgi:hypothetical protein